MVRMSMILENWDFGELEFWDGFTRPKARKKAHHKHQEKKNTHFGRRKEKKEEGGREGEQERGGETAQNGRSRCRARRKKLRVHIFDLWRR
jgi:hypothetical protein